MNLLLKAGAGGRRPLPLATVEANTVVPGDLTLPRWGYLYSLTEWGQQATPWPTIRLATALEGGNELDEYIVNPSSNAGVSGIWLFGTPVTTPSGVTSVTISCEVRSVAGDAAQTVGLGVINEAQDTWLSHSEFALSGTWTARSRTYSTTTADLFLRVLLHNHSAWGCTANARLLIRNVRVTFTASSGVFAGDYYRVGAERNLRGDTRGIEKNYTRRHQRQDAQAHLSVITRATAYLAEIASDLVSGSPSYPSQAKTAVTVDGAENALLVNSTVNKAQYAGGTLSAGTKQVEVFAGLAFEQSPDNTTPDVRSSCVQALYLPQAAGAPRLGREHGPRIYILADSIGAGWQVNDYAATRSWAGLLRARGARLCLDAVGGGQLKHVENLPATSGYAQTGFAQPAARAAAFGARSIVIALMVNDFSANSYTPAQFGTAIAACVAAFHGACPDARVYVITAFNVGGGAEAVPNAGGYLLQEYRDAATSALSELPYVTVGDGTAISSTSGADLYGDGIHPTESGHAYAEAHVAALLGLS